MAAIFSASNGMSRLISVTAATYPSGVISEALAHSISPARSRTSSVLTWSRARLAAWATTANLRSSSSQPVEPTTRGQKYCSWRRAAAWKVSACTAATEAPGVVSMARRRLRISPAAREVNVTASTWPAAT